MKERVRERVKIETSSVHGYKKKTTRIQFVPMVSFYNLNIISR